MPEAGLLLVAWSAIPFAKRGTRSEPIKQDVDITYYATNGPLQVIS